MLVRTLFTILIFLSAVVESTLLPFPFVFLLSSIFFLFFEGIISFIVILLGAILLDILSLNHLGYTPFFLFSYFIFILILENIFANKNSLFTGIVLIMGVFLYGYFSSYTFIPWLFMPLIFAVMLFSIFERRSLEKKEGKLSVS
jgi:hypothetical protein